MHSKRVVVAVVVFLLTMSAAALAGPFTSVIAYGDSLSDNGNLYQVAGRPPSPPYFNGRFSNGPVAVEDLAAAVGAPLFDFAWGGATTGVGNYADNGTTTEFGSASLPGMTTLFDSTESTVAPMASTALFVVWGGANDFLAPSPADAGDPFKTADRGVANLLAIVAGLQSIGAQHILVPGIPDIGLTPTFVETGMGALGSSLTDYFNGRLQAGLPTGVTYFDTAALVRDIHSRPAAYGLTNVTDACLTTACTTPDSYLFWDDFHPTARVHEIAAQQFAEAAVPEPATALLGLTALAFGIAARRVRNHVIQASDDAPEARRRHRKPLLIGPMTRFARLSPLKLSCRLLLGSNRSRSKSSRSTVVSGDETQHYAAPNQTAPLLSRTP